MTKAIHELFDFTTEVRQENGESLFPVNERDHYNHLITQNKVTNDLKIAVFKSITCIINRKGASNKMVTVDNVISHLKSNGVYITPIIVKAVFSYYIKLKYMRYYKFKNTYYYGITKLGWKMWNAHQETKCQNCVHKDTCTFKEVVRSMHINYCIFMEELEGA